MGCWGWSLSSTPVLQYSNAPVLLMLSSFHFLRPYWLLMILPAIVIYWLLWRQQSASRQWSSAIAPHLLKHLIVGSEQQKRVRPSRLLLPLLIIAALAMAGPTWKREPTPFTEDQAPLVIALDVSSSMEMTDIQPSRLQRAQQKVRDLLAERSGARTALLAYAGSAHTVLPLTDDQNILEMYVEALSPAIMPEQGKDAAKALALAKEMLAKEEVPGTILFLTDGISKEQVPAFADFHRQNKDQVAVLGIGTTMEGIKNPLDREGLEALSKEAGVYVSTVTVDDSDVQRINRRITSHLKAVQSEDKNQRWQDFGYWLLYPTALLILFWFRRGWTIQWAAGLILVFSLFSPSPVEAKEFRFIDLWLTPDQQGRYYFDKGEYQTAAERFEDPMWKGTAYYAGEDFEAAIEQFSTLESPQAYFNLGNAYAQNEQYEDALTSYDKALELRPDFEEAIANRALMEEILKKQEEEKLPASQSGFNPELGPDEIRIADEEQKKKREFEEGEVDSSYEGMSDETLTELWMRQVQTSPADFLRVKFLYQLQKKKEKEK